MASVRIVTDGGADLPVELAAAHRIRVVTGPIHFGEQAFDGDASAFWRQVRSGAPIPSTAPPSIDALTDAYRGHEPVCAIHVSAELSRTEGHATSAAAKVPNPVHVVDSRSLSIGTGLVAMVAAQAAAVDIELERMKPIVRGLVDRVHVHAVIEAVDYLLRGGRAGLLDTDSIKRDARQVIAVRGHAIRLGQAKDRRHAVRDLLHHIAADHLHHGVDHWAIGHGDAADIDDITAQAEKVFGMPPTFVTLLGPAVGTHAGMDAVAIGLIAHP